MENRPNDLRDMGKEQHRSHESEQGIVLPVIEERVIISKEEIETGRVLIQKRVAEEQVSVNIPVIQEGYEVERLAGTKELLTEHPPIRYEGENIIIPVVREVLVIEKRYEVLEEVHIIKTRSKTPHLQEITLRKETVEVKRKNAQQ